MHLLGAYFCLCHSRQILDDSPLSLFSFSFKKKRRLKVTLFGYTATVKLSKNNAEKCTCQTIWMSGKVIKSRLMQKKCNNHV